MAGEKIKKLVIEDGTIRKMLLSAEYKAEFPFIASAAAAMKEPTEKKCCGGKVRKIYSGIDYNGIKQQIAGLAEDRRIKLKEMLNTEKAVVVYKGTKRISVSF